MSSSVKKSIFFSLKSVADLALATAPPPAGAAGAADAGAEALGCSSAFFLAGAAPTTALRSVAALPGAAALASFPLALPFAVAAPPDALPSPLAWRGLGFADPELFGAALPFSPPPLSCPMGLR